MIQDFFDFETLREDYDVEVKEASGSDGMGKLPNSIWETYSAMANTEGGYIILGGKQKKNAFEWIGVANTDKVIKELWNGANNRQKVSINLLQNKDVHRNEHQGADLVIIHVPQAKREQRPVYIGSNPLTGTFKRNNDGDYRCPEDVVKQMLGEQVNDTRDAVIIDGYDSGDINTETLKIYRQNFANRKPDHPFHDYDDLEFLRQIGGWREDRQTGQKGITLAGLLMFGKLRSILDVVPTYIVDYQESSRSLVEHRWIDRVTTDFTWSGNLYDFYRIVMGKLTADLKVPFVLKGDSRIDDTPVHEALREALVNTIIHADYSGRCSVLAVKRPDLFGFRNPGLLRIPREEAIRGGISDCRNRNLQKMFQLIGLGEQAGSGFPKIYRNWESQHWKKPDLEERIESEQTILALRMTSLLPEDVVNDLQKKWGKRFESTTKVERVALVTARAEHCVTHRRLKELSREHSHDLTLTLHGLVEKGLLDSDGSGKGTFYYIPGEHPIRAGDLDLLSAQPPISSEHLAANSEHLASNSEHLASNSEHLASNSEHLTSNSEHLEYLKNLAKPVANSGRVKMELMREVIVKLCNKREFSIIELAGLLNRSEDTIRTHYINLMCDEGILERKYPNILNHPDQRYLKKR